MRLREISMPQRRMALTASNKAQRLSSRTDEDVVTVNIQALPTNAGYVAIGLTTATVTAITDINGTTVKVTTAAAHNLTTGQKVTIEGVLGVTGFDGAYAVTVLTSTTFSVVFTIGSDTYTSGGEITDISIESGIEKGDILAAFGTTQKHGRKLSDIWVIGTSGDGVLYNYERY